MLEDDEIFTLLGEKVLIIKETENRVNGYQRKHGAFNRDELPEFTPVYKDTVHLAKKIRVHSTVETFPETLFRLKAPNESIEQWEYRQANYRPKTKAAWSRAVGSALRIWNEQNWALQFNEDDSLFNDKESASTYFNETYPEFRSITTFFKSVVHKRKFDDPNIMVSNKPKSIPDDQTELIEPVTVLYRSDQVLENTDNVVMILLDEKSFVKVGSKDEKEGLVFEIYDDTNIYRAEQTGEKKDWEFNVFIWYPHELGYLPCTLMKGIPVQDKDDLYYESHFNDAVASLDEALYDFSNLQLSKTSHAFPQRVEVAERCDECEGSGECKIGGEGEFANENRRCNLCNGTGDANRQAVLGVSKWFKPERTDAESEIPFPGIQYVEPGTAIYNFLNEQINQNIIDAFMMLNLDVTNKATTGSKLDESATKSKIDREELFAFLESIKDQEFKLFAFCIETQGLMRYGDRWQGFTLKEPTEFAIRNSAELTDEIVKAQEAKLPTSILSNLNEQYAQTRFATNDNQKKIIVLQSRIDSLLYNTVTEIISMVGTGRTASWKATMHFEWNQILSDLIEKEPDFFNLEFEKQKELIVIDAKARDLDNKPITPDPAEVFKQKVSGES